MHFGDRNVAHNTSCLSRPAFPGLVLVLALALAALPACTVGPNFKKPVPPGIAAYTAAPLPSSTAAAPVPGGESQRFADGREIPAQWWALFHNQELDRLIGQALVDSPSLAAAQAALRQASENRRAQYGALWPSLDANFSATRQKFSSAAFGDSSIPSSIFTLYNASVNVSYNFDFFGGTRRAIEASVAQLNYQRFQLEGAHLTLTSNIVTTAIQEASLRARIRATLEIIAAEEEQVKLMERRLELGAGALPELLAQQAQLAQTRTGLPPLEKELAQSRHQLAVLCGKFPAEAAALPQFELADLQLPQELPVSLPSELVRQRPDVLASEELLHEASAQVGVATANQFPKITLSAGLGPQATAFGDLFSSGATVWSIGAGILQPIFHGGELSARRRAASAALEQAQAQYRITVLQAFQNVADVLRALELDAQALRAQAAAEKAARDSLDLARKQYSYGALNYLLLLDSERQHRQARITLAQAQAARYADTAALFQALGGGWWNREGQQPKVAEAVREQTK
jgi:NodT family efflux transporter outer membrane factor (OMF) lipoprotein